MAKKETKFGLEKFAPALILLVIALSFAVGYLFNKINSLEQNINNPTVAGTANPPSAPTTGKLSADKAEKVPPVSEDDHIRGSRDAEVFIVEYSDLECPFCARFHPTAKQAVDEYEGKVAWVYRHFPLSTIHPKAIPAAIASECVAELGGSEAFWAFTDYIFENQTTALADLAGAAGKTGLNSAAVQTCIDSDKYADKVDQQYSAGANAGVTGTPGNFIINKNSEVWLLPGAVPFENLKATIDEALES